MAEFSYDQDGSNTIIFILAALVLYLAPTTFWKISEWTYKPEGLQPGAYNAKFESLAKRKNRPLLKEKRGFSLGDIVYIAAWILFFFMLYKASGIDAPVEEVWDPYGILGLETGATDKQIKSAYRKLSVQLHPDKNPGNESAHEIYLQVVKAHQTLTDDATRENWEKYGHPDGKRAIEFGIALPAWMVGDEYKWLILAIYFVGIMVVLPVVVATWWWNSKKYTRDRLLRQTVNLYYQYLRMQMPMRAIIEILSASVEFLEQIPQRPNDAELLKDVNAQLIKEVPGLEPFLTGQTKFNSPYVLKAKTLLWAQMLRIKNLPAELEHDKAGFATVADLLHPNADQALILAMCPSLIQGMINMASLRRWMPLTITCMHAQQLLVQGMVDEAQPKVFQLPYVDDESFKVFDQNKIINIQDFVKMDNAARREMLKHLTDAQYEEMVTVANSVPWIDVIGEAEVVGEDNIYTNSLITIKATLTRCNWLELEALHKSRMEEAEKPAEEKKDDGLRKRKGSKAVPEDDEDETIDTSDQNKIFKEKINTHPVYCPYWPQQRQEGAWVFLADNRHQLIGHPIRVDDLIDKKIVEIQMPPVAQVGQYRFALWVVPDSYNGSDTRTTVEFNSVEAPQVVTVPSDDEDEGLGEEEKEKDQMASDVESEIESDIDDME